MKLGVTQRLLDQDPRRARSLLDELGGDVDAALIELRALAHGIVPPLLLERGLAAALAEVAARAALPTRTDIQDVGRADAAGERAVYFCCLEALQNAAKHAGPDARATMTLSLQNTTLSFSVRDNGTGMPPAAVTRAGGGLANMRERIAALGGQLKIETVQVGGTCVRGEVPRWPRQEGSA